MKPHQTVFLIFRFVILATIVSTFAFVACSKDDESTVVSAAPTIYVEKSQLVAVETVDEKEFSSDNSYLASTRTYRGPAWYGIHDSFFFYQLLLGGIGEFFHIYVEKIGWRGYCDQLHLVNRMEIHPEIFGQSGYRFHPELVNWISPEVVRLLIDREKEYDLNISTMTVVTVDNAPLITFFQAEQNH